MFGPLHPFGVDQPQPAFRMQDICTRLGHLHDSTEPHSLAHTHKAWMESDGLMSLVAQQTQPQLAHEASSQVMSESFSETWGAHSISPERVQVSHVWWLTQVVSELPH